MANRIFHIRVRQFPVWFRAAIAAAVLVAFYGFIWSLVRPTHGSLFDLNNSVRSIEPPTPAEAADTTISQVHNPAPLPAPTR